MSSLYECPSCGCKTFSSDTRCQRCGTPLAIANIDTIPDTIPDPTSKWPKSGEKWVRKLSGKTGLISSVDAEHGVVIWQYAEDGKFCYHPSLLNDFIENFSPVQVAGEAYPDLGSDWICHEDGRAAKIISVDQVAATVNYRMRGICGATYQIFLHDFLADFEPAPAPAGGFGGHQYYIGGLPVPGSVWIDKLTWPDAKVVIQQSNSKGVKFSYPGQDGIHWLPLQAFLQYYVRPDDRPEPAKPADPLGSIPKAGSQWQKIMTSQFDVQVTVTRANADYVYFTVDGHVPVTGDDGTRNFHLGRFLKAYKPVSPVKPAIPIWVKLSEEAASKLRDPRKAVSSGLLCWLDSKDAPEPNLDDLLASDFAECPTCAAKAGSPTLCQACVQNRTLISFMKKELEGRAEDDDSHKPLLFGSEAEEDARVIAEIDGFLKAAEDQSAKDMQAFKDNPGLGAKVAANARELAALGVSGLDRKTQEEILENGFADDGVPKLSSTWCCKMPDGTLCKPELVVVKANEHFVKFHYVGELTVHVREAGEFLDEFVFERLGDDTKSVSKLHPEACLHTAENGHLTAEAAESPRRGDEFVVLSDLNGRCNCVDFWLCVLRVADDTVWTAERLSVESGWAIVEKSHAKFRERILYVGFGSTHRPFKLNSRGVDVTSICRILEESEAKGKGEAEKIEAKKRRSDVVDALERQRSDVVDALEHPERGFEFYDSKADRKAIVVTVNDTYVWTYEKHACGTWQVFKHTLGDFAKSWTEAVQLISRISLVTESHDRMVAILEGKTRPQDAPARPEPSSANYDPSEMSEDEVCERLEAYLRYCSAGLRLRRLARRALGFTKDVKRGEESAETEPSDWQGRPNG